MCEVLERQIKEKENRKDLAKSQENIVYPQKIYKFTENYDTCYNCHKLYPTKVLNLTKVQKGSVN